MVRVAKAGMHGQKVLRAACIGSRGGPDAFSGNGDSGKPAREVCATEVLPGPLSRVVTIRLDATLVALSKAKVGRIGERASDS